MSTDRLLAAIDDYYTEKVRSHGATPRGVDWNGAEGQELRFEQLLALLPERAGGYSLNDYGCGYGALLEILARREESFTYVGYDVSSAMIEQAREKYAHDTYASFTSSRAELVPADFTVASGIFNVKLDIDGREWTRYVHETIDQMARLSRCGMAFNALTAHSDEHRKRADLYYADPAELLDRCLRRYSRDIELRHNYELYEFTVLVWLDRRPPISQERLTA